MPYRSYGHDVTVSSGPTSRDGALSMRPASLERRVWHSRSSVAVDTASATVSQMNDCTNRPVSQSNELTTHQMLVSAVHVGIGV